MLIVISLFSRARELLEEAGRDRLSRDVLDDEGMPKGVARDERLRVSLASRGSAREGGRGESMERWEGNRMPQACEEMWLGWQVGCGSAARGKLVNSAPRSIHGMAWHGMAWCLLSRAHARVILLHCASHSRHCGRYVEERRVKRCNHQCAARYLQMRSKCSSHPAPVVPFTLPSSKSDCETCATPAAMHA